MIRVHITALTTTALVLSIGCSPTTPAPTPPPPVCLENYCIGGAGPAGGIVFYIDQSLDHGLEAATVDIDVAGEYLHEWGCLGIDVPGADAEALETGAQNTAEILAQGCTSSDGSPIAAELAESYTYNGFNDWYLPSVTELQAMHSLLHNNGYGGFGDEEIYWSSTENDSDRAVYQLFANGHLYAGPKDNGRRVRAIRAF